MPPFKAGLLKRKNDDKEENVDTTETKDAVKESDDEGSDLQLDMSAAGIVDDSGESSELEDSDDDDESEEDNGSDEEDGDNDSDDDQSDDSNVSQESGLGETHSGSSEADQDTAQNLLKSSKKILKKKAATNDFIITRSKSKGRKESGVEQTEGNSSDEATQGEMAAGRGEGGALARLAQQIASTHVTDGRDEYSSGDTSDEEDRRNPRGAVPAHWYDEFDHVGYDLQGRRLLRPARRSAIDDFLKRCEDPEFWRTVRDPATGQDVLLSGADLALLARLKKGLAPTAPDDEYQPWTEWFSREVLATPVRAFPEHKRSFLPSASEKAALARLVHALRCGWRKTRRQLAAERAARKERKFYDLWGAEVEGEPRAARSAPPPRRPPPGHAESYNPPPEYLLDDKEMKEWNKLSATPWKRKYSFLPARHGSLRAVAAYPRYTRERFLRCLDLYLAPRGVRRRLLIGAAELVPRLPAPRDLRPFPASEVLALVGHVAAVRALDVDPGGRYCCSGSDDGTVKVWELATGRCLRTFALGGAVTCAAWAPAGPGLLAAAAGGELRLIAPLRPAAAAALRLLPPAAPAESDARTQATAQWCAVDAAAWASGTRAAVRHVTSVAALAWHARGDYLAAAVVGPRGVVVHQVSRRRSQLPLSKAKGAVQDVLFHPHRPFLFVATQRVVRVYDLVQQCTLRTLRPGAQWLSRLALHPGGDHLLVASYDRKCLWFDLDLSSAPYQALRLHAGAVRAVAFHPRYPLFASAGDDRVVVSHATVYNDLLQNPLIVPLKQLAGPARTRGLCALALRWHPAQPWLLVAGADGTVRLLA